MKKISIMLAGIIILFGTAAMAQTGDIKDSVDTFIPDFSSDPDMKPVEKRAGDFILSYGGWITAIYLDDIKKNDAGDDQLSSSLTVAKIWAKTTFMENFNIYIRGKDTYLKVIEDSRETVDDENRIELDAAYLSWTSDDKMLNASLGRKLYHMGTGLVFSGTGDGGEIGFYSKFVNIEAFGVYTGMLDKDTNPYKLSGKDFQDNAKRVFYGGTVSNTISNQKIYILYMSQIDQGEDASETVKTKYNSTYYGAGLEGTILNALYYAEYIIENGKSYMTENGPPSQSIEKKDIKAQAGNFGLNYYFDIPLSPALLLNYSFGSGDKDRSGATNPAGNNAGNDQGFIYFGNFVGGFALRPSLSNIHIYRAGFSINPVAFLDNKQLNRMSLVCKYSYYQKDVSSGAISDAEGSGNSANIGDGIDVSLRWKIFYDFSAFVNYGLFRPGDAYPDNVKNKTFVMGGINLMI